MELLKVLNERYATKKMNGAIVPEEKSGSNCRGGQIGPYLFRFTTFQGDCYYQQGTKGKNCTDCL